MARAINLVIMRRPKGSLLALPRSLATTLPEGVALLSVRGTTGPFMKLQLASPREIVEEIILPEKNELLGPEAEHSDPFVGVALKLLQARHDALYIPPDITLPDQRATGREESHEPSPSVLSYAPGVVTKKAGEYQAAFGSDSEPETVRFLLPLEDGTRRILFNQPTSSRVYVQSGLPSEEGVNTLPGETTLSLNAAAEEFVPKVTPPPSQGTKQSSSDDFYWYYQAADGQHVFLHSINVRCLVQVRSFQAYESFRTSEKLTVILRECITNTFTCTPLKRRNSATFPSVLKLSRLLLSKSKDLL